MKEKSENCRRFSAAKNACRKVGRPSPSYKLRKLSEEDIPVLQTLFRETVLHVNARDYTREEVEDWASCGDSAEHMKDLLARNDYVAALNEQGEIIGFSSMNTVVFQKVCLCRRLQILQICKYSDSWVQNNTPRRVILLFVL